jgi:uncharacterized membrane protein YgaE (UPF0421/DUF939 family)
MQGQTLMLNLIDIKMAFATGICLLIGNLIPEFQVMTACIATLLCVQENMKPSLKAGIIRLIITAIGGFAGILVVLVDDAAGNSLLFILLVMLGLVITLFGCRLAKVPAFNARIGGVTFILVVLTKQGQDRIPYAVFRLLSTFYGVFAVLLITTVFNIFAPEKESI